MGVIHYDLCVIGGGINGAGIARDAAGRGLSVLLVEAADLAGATSSASTKLIHGGLRYLEYYEFKLVRESLREREVLLELAPHIIWPMDFVLPHDTRQRPYPLIRMGLFLYDHLAPRFKIKRSKSLNLNGCAEGVPLKDAIKKGFRYTDCWVEDSRLVVLNAMDAAENGAEIKTRTACTQLEHRDGKWSVGLRDLEKGEDSQVTASMAVNAAGPWVRGVLEGSNMADAPGVPRIRLVKGSHIIVKRRYEGGHAYILQQPDGRVVFVLPYEHDYTLIGTTEEEYEGDPVDAKISDGEMRYLCESYNRSFKDPLSPADVQWTYSGVRPLFDEGEESATSATRDYKLHHHKEYKAPLISVFGGKITTYRVLAEKTVNMILGAAGKGGAAWTSAHPLPGGELDAVDFESFMHKQETLYPWLPHELLLRYARAYGSRMDAFLDRVDSFEGLGEHYGDQVYQAEICYLIEQEWARTAEDILWRRSKLGLHVAPKTVQNLETALPDILAVYQDNKKAEE